MNELERTLRDAAAKLPAPPPEAAGHGLARAAADARLLDVAYSGVDTPFGRLLVAATPRGLVHVSFPEAPTDSVLERLATRLSPRMLEAPERLDEVRRELDEYFQGRRRRFDLPLDWSLARGFHRSVLRTTARIGYGRVRSYSEVAARAGSPRAVRATGNALGANPIPVVVPCHRVVRTGGALGGYGGGLDRKEYLLRLEGALPG
ncbi:MAG: methylated-DNA--[protein]-cysteine S-methyltransferase [Thermoleophilaceae bacterium]